MQPSVALLAVKHVETSLVAEQEKVCVKSDVGNSAIRVPSM